MLATIDLHVHESCMRVAVKVLHSCAFIIQVTIIIKIAATTCTGYNNAHKSAIIVLRGGGGSIVCFLSVVYSFPLSGGGLCTMRLCSRRLCSGSFPLSGGGLCTVRLCSRRLCSSSFCLAGCGCLSMRRLHV